MESGCKTLESASSQQGSLITAVTYDRVYKSFNLGLKQIIEEENRLRKRGNAFNPLLTKVL
jgi:hypothetical protein